MKPYLPPAGWGRHRLIMNVKREPKRLLWIQPVIGLVGREVSACGELLRLVYQSPPIVRHGFRVPARPPHRVMTAFQTYSIAFGRTSRPRITLWLFAVIHVIGHYFPVFEHDGLPDGLAFGIFCFLGR